MFSFFPNYKSISWLEQVIFVGYRIIVKLLLKQCPVTPTLFQSDKLPPLKSLQSNNSANQSSSSSRKLEQIPTTNRAQSNRKRKNYSISSSAETSSAIRSLWASVKRMNTVMKRSVQLIRSGLGRAKPKILKKVHLKEEKRVDYQFAWKAHKSMISKSNCKTCILVKRLRWAGVIWMFSLCFMWFLLFLLFRLLIAWYAWIGISVHLLARLVFLFVIVECVSSYILYKSLFTAFYLYSCLLFLVWKFACFLLFVPSFSLSAVLPVCFIICLWLYLCLSGLLYVFPSVSLSACQSLYLCVSLSI